MKHINVKQIACLLCLAVLLAGCAPQPVDHYGTIGTGDRFVVDGITYFALITCGTKDGKIAHSIIWVSPDVSPLRYRMSVWYDERGRPRAGLYRDATIDPGRTIIADVPFNFAYFIDNGKIVRQKSYEELGIDVSDPMRVFDERKLSPILEQLIRENVQPQEPEMEEE